MHEQYFSFRNPKLNTSYFEQHKRDSGDTYSALTGKTYLVNGPNGPVRQATNYRKLANDFES